MGSGIRPRLALAAAAILVVSAVGSAPSTAAVGPARPTVGNRWMVVAKSDQDFAGLRADILAAGGRILNELPGIQTFVVAGGSGLRTLANDVHASGVAADHIEKLTPPEGGTTTGRPVAPHPPFGGGHSKVTPDPAFSLPGLMWNVNRINAPQAWRTSTGSPDVTVGVADTGLDYTHSELATHPDSAAGA